MTRFATIYTHNDERSNAFATINNEPSLTQQSDAADADINVIMQRFGATGQLPSVVVPGKYGDFTNVVDFREAQEIIREANEAFLTVPAKVREQFGNDPSRFFEFVNDPDNIDQLEAMGLAKRKEPPQEGPNDEISRFTPPPRYDDNNGAIPDPPQQESSPNGNAQQPGATRANVNRPAVPPAGGPGGRAGGR